MKHTGIITAAGQELSGDKTKKVFKLHLENPKYTYTLFNDSQKEFAEENIGNLVTVEYGMSGDGKYRQVESIELATDAQTTALDSWDDAIDTQDAAKIVKDLWITGTITKDDPLVEGLRERCGKLLGLIPATIEVPKSTKAPTYKDKDGDDVSRATDAQKERLKKMLGTPDDDSFTNAIRTRLGDEVLRIKDLSKDEAGQWIMDLQKEQ